MECKRFPCIPFSVFFLGGCVGTMFHRPNSSGEAILQFQRAAESAAESAAADTDAEAAEAKGRAKASSASDRAETAEAKAASAHRSGSQGAGGDAQRAGGDAQRAGGDAQRAGGDAQARGTQESFRKPAFQPKTHRPRDATSSSTLASREGR